MFLDVCSQLMVVSRGLAWLATLWGKCAGDAPLPPMQGGGVIQGGGGIRTRAHVKRTRLCTLARVHTGTQGHTGTFRICGPFAGTAGALRHWDPASSA